MKEMSAALAQRVPRVFKTLTVRQALIVLNGKKMKLQKQPGGPLELTWR